MPETPYPSSQTIRSRRITVPGLIRGAVWWALGLGVAYALVACALQHSVTEHARMLWTINSSEPPTHLPVPVQGVRASQIAHTFGAPRGPTRRHEGIDIFARRGTPVLSATPGIVTAVREGGLGGKVVWVMGPGRQRHYYAHLDDWAEGISAGTVVQQGQQLGTVGNTGNARGTPPHLHYGIYGSSGAFDPLPLLRAGAAAGL